MTWDHIKEGNSYIKKVKQWESKGCNTDYFGEIDLEDPQILQRLHHLPQSHDILPCERGELLFLKAFEEALQMTEISQEYLSGKKVGIFLGTSLSGFTKLEREYTANIRENRQMSIRSFLVFPIHIVADRLAYEYRLCGPRFVFSTACSASLHPVIWGKNFLEAGEIDLAVIGGTDPLSLISMAGFSSLRSLAKKSASPFSTTDPEGKDLTGLFTGIVEGGVAGLIEMEAKQQWNG